MNYGMRLELLVCHFEIDQNHLVVYKIDEIVSRLDIFRVLVQMKCGHKSLCVLKANWAMSGEFPSFLHLYNFASS